MIHHSVDDRGCRTYSIRVDLHAAVGLLPLGRPAWRDTRSKTLAMSAVTTAPGLRRAQPPDHQVVVAALAQLLGREREGEEHLRHSDCSATSNARRHHADDRVRVSIEPNGSADRLWIAGELGDP